MERNILQDKQINRFKLDEEAERQPDLYHYYASKVVEARKERDSLKNSLKAKEGALQIAILTGERPLPLDKSGKPIKLTNPTIESLIDTNADIVVARELLALAEQKLGELVSAETTMEHRRGMLKLLVELYTREYYSPIHEGEAPRSGKVEQLAEVQREALNRKKRENKE